MTVLPYRNLIRFLQGRHNSYNTSVEILAAIEAVTDTLLPEDTVNPIWKARQNTAARVWAAPSTDERAEVLELAWKIAPADKNTLIWGATRFQRPNGSA